MEFRTEVHDEANGERHIDRLRRFLVAMTVEAPS